MSAIVQLVVLLLQLLPEVLRAWRDYRREHGGLSQGDRMILTDALKTAVATKNTSDLEAFLKGKADAKSGAAPNAKDLQAS